MHPAVSRLSLSLSLFLGDSSLLSESLCESREFPRECSEGTKRDRITAIYIYS